MKKLFATTLLLVLSLTTQAQTDVTKFLGIPVDGTKPEMIRQLKAKGFRNSPYNNEILEGEFNGSNVYVSVATNNNKVWRIMVSDATPTDVRNVQIRFNRLCKQFENNPNYVTLKDYTIPDDEDIRVQILLNKKRYEAAFYLKPEVPLSGMYIVNVFRRFLLYYRICDHLQLLPDHLLTLCFRICRCIIFEIFLQRHQGVGLAAIDDLPGLQK